VVIIGRHSLATKLRGWRQNPEDEGAFASGLDLILDGLERILDSA
jgi:hypothetical protein